MNEDQINQICDRTRHELLALLLSVPAAVNEPVPSLPEWMTARQLAEYWQLYVGEEPATAGIMKWARRPADQFPLPHARMGDMTRFRREDADRWAIEEASRRVAAPRRGRNGHDKSAAHSVDFAHSDSRR